MTVKPRIRVESIQLKTNISLFSLYIAAARSAGLKSPFLMGPSIIRENYIYTQAGALWLRQF